MSTNNTSPRHPSATDVAEGPLTKAAQAGLDALRADPMAAAAAMMRRVPTGPLPGTITLARRKSAAVAPVSRPAGLPALHVPPTRAGAAALRVGEEIAAAVLTEGVPAALAGRAALYATVAGPICFNNRSRGLERRGPFVGEAAAAHYVNYAQPQNLDFARPGQLRAFYNERLEDLACHAYGFHDDNVYEDGDTAAQAAGTFAADEDICDCGRLHSAPMTADLTSRPRLVWAHCGGIGEGLLLDRFHGTYFKSVIERDRAIQGKVVKDMRRVAAFLAPADNLTDRVTGDSAGHGTDDTTLEYLTSAILGVRVISHLVPNDAVHYLPAFEDGAIVLGKQHRVGDCEVCVCVTDLPNSRPAGTTRPTSRDQEGCVVRHDEQQLYQGVRPSAGLFNPTRAFRPVKTEDNDVAATEIDQSVATAGRAS